MLYEEDLLKSPYLVTGWLRYLNHKAEAAPEVRFILYERAVRGVWSRRPVTKSQACSHASYLLLPCYTCSSTQNCRAATSCGSSTWTNDAGL